MRFSLLGPIEAADDQGRVVNLGSRRQRELLGLLLLHAGDTVPIDSIVDAIWEDRLPGSPAKAVRSYISRLRRVLGPGVIETRSQGFVIPSEGLDLDVWEFRELAGRGRELIGSARFFDASQVLKESLDLWRGRPLGEFVYETFAQQAAAGLEEERLAARIDLIAARLNLGEHDSMLGELESLVNTHPFSERLRGQRMVALYRSGRGAEALRAYQDFRSFLGEEMGVEPSPSLRALEGAILLQDLALNAPASAINTGGNLPARIASFVGRDSLMAELAILLGQHRLITLTGLGGFGKSSLAIEAARRQRERFPGGAWLVELTNVSQPGLVADALASALGVRELAGMPLMDTLIEVLSGRPSLVVLDNCEHLIDATAELIGRLLAGSEMVSVLVTSRHPLAAEGEVQFQVPPLQIHTGADDEESEAAQLFYERARQLDSDFSTEMAGRRDVDRICELLDGIPLAIELAAVLTPLMSPQELANQLEDRFGLLDDLASVGSSHPQLRATIEWSYDLLSEDDRTLVRRLSVLVGGFDLDTALRVAAGGGGRQGTVSSLHYLSHKSLIRRVPGSEPSRYSMLDTVRQFAGEALAASGEETQLRIQHLLCFSEFADRAAASIASSPTVAWFDGVGHELANIRAAIEYAIDTGEMGRAVGIIAGLEQFWRIRSNWTEIDGYLERCLETDETLTTHTTAHALLWRGKAALERGDYSIAETMLDESRRLLLGRGDYEGAARALVYRSESEAFNGAESAEETAKRAFAEALEIGAVRLQTLALFHLANGMMMRGLVPEALVTVEDVLRLATAAGDAELINGAAIAAGKLTYRLGRAEEAAGRLESALQSARDLGDEVDQCQASVWLAAAQTTLGEYHSARTTIERGLTLARGDRFLRAMCLRHLGRLQLAEGDAVAAAETLRSSLRNMIEMVQGSFSIVLILTDLADALAASGESGRAAVLIGFVDAACDASSLGPLDRADRESVFARLDQELGQGVLLAGMETGREMNRDEAVAFAIEPTNIEAEWFLQPV